MAIIDNGYIKTGSSCYSRKSQRKWCSKTSYRDIKKAGNVRVFIIVTLINLIIKQMV